LIQFQITPLGVVAPNGEVMLEDHSSVSPLPDMERLDL
jgi:hypothetical protein